MYSKNFIFFAFFCATSSFSISKAQQVTAKKQTLPSNWHYLSQDQTGFYGVSADKAHKFLDSLKLTPKKITVAVIDADLNINHEDLKDRIWKNPRPGAKGYTNDVNGWNFLGNKNGQTLVKTGTEAFREYKRLKPRFENVKPEQLKTEAEKNEYVYFRTVRAEAKINSYIKFGQYTALITNAFRITDSVIKATKFDHEPMVADVMKLKIADSAINEQYGVVSRSMFKYKNNDLWKDIYSNQLQENETVVNRIKSLDDKTSPRDLIGDADNIKDKYYGNANLFEKDSYHGTFVAGLIGAVRNNGIGIDGIADSVAIMGVRAVPDGDEYDKDIALAIYYAVDNGAKLINMSFGKYYSPHSQWVNEAIQYANKKGVLLFHASGNEGKNVDSIMVYPSGMLSATKRAENLIRVGASTPTGEAAAISNYGAANVDIFAPGISIRSTGLNNGYQIANGTSLSAPIVTGVAALLWSYFPQLSAKQIKTILLASVTSRKGHLTSKPGKVKDQIVFENLCTSAGIVNAYQAVKMAQQMLKTKV
ncbi:MAG: S8 family serine peptidase [Candidatus Pedobacter colombiensis]|uniref:S8 family serine peptidase n=1 Tax=Candidatus Pedobacter colombiensis TaxID=3121371 RepID=A0AAJ5W4M2_9SPHI|nr:S8 family serine peptidase [Pedobacter sp.]WEK17495.1 MAG: S8 family serine peptidase [Pedobacter sp.]